MLFSISSRENDGMVGGYLFENYLTSGGLGAIYPPSNDLATRAVFAVMIEGKLKKNASGRNESVKHEEEASPY